jgi:methionine-rich copper-binding protein CopC
VLLACALADAKPLHIRDSVPKAEAIFDGRNAQYLIRFDGLVDHGASGMVITRDEKLVETLVPSGDSEPDVLAASAPALAPGRYQLHWHAKSVPDGDFSDGFISFTIAR